MAKKADAIKVEAAVVEIQSKTLFDRVSDYLTERDWSFSSFPEKGYFSFGLRLRDGSVRVLVDVADGAGWSRVLVYCIYSTFVPEQRRQAVSEAIARINYSTVFGNLEMDLDDGEVRIRTVLEGDGFFGESIIDRAVRKSLDLADQYQAALLAVAFGNESPGNILQMAERPDGSTIQ